MVQLVQQNRSAFPTSKKIFRAPRCDSKCISLNKNNKNQQNSKPQDMNWQTWQNKREQKQKVGAVEGWASPVHHVTPVVNLLVKTCNDDDGELFFSERSNAPITIICRCVKVGEGPVWKAQKETSAIGRAQAFQTQVVRGTTIRCRTHNQVS